MNPYRVRNLYNCSLGTFPENVTVELLNMHSPDLIQRLMNSDKWVEVHKKRENAKPEKYSLFDYSIISVNDRSVDNINTIKNTLVDYRFHKIDYFMASANNYKDFFNDRHITIDWRPEYSYGRTEPFIGEFGICGSQILVLEYMVKNNIPEMIVFEDDVELSDKFVDYLNLCYADLPKDYDFLSDTTVFPNEREFATVTQPILIGSEYIYKSYLQNAHLGFVLYSLSGAKKILALLKEIGVFAPIDTMLFHFSRSGQLNGYSTFFFNRLISNKDMLGSLIDENGIRK